MTKMEQKTRECTIKRIASKDESRPALRGYGVFGEYKGVTDSYHAIMIKQDEMPIPLSKQYPDLMRYFDSFDKSDELTLDINDLKQFIKEHREEKMALYKMGDSTYQARYIKNIINVLGKDCKIYYLGGRNPLYFVNKENEMGLVLPVVTY